MSTCFRLYFQIVGLLAVIRAVLLDLNMAIEHAGKLALGAQALERASLAGDCDALAVSSAKAALFDLSFGGRRIRNGNSHGAGGHCGENSLRQSAGLLEEKTTRTGKHSPRRC